MISAFFNFTIMKRMFKFKNFFWSILSLFITGIGIAFSTRPGLGTSPIASPSYALTFVLPLTFGMCTVLVNIFMILGQMAILRKDFNYFQFSQLISASLLGIFIDIGIWISNFFVMGNYFSLLSWQVFGCIILAIGISIELAANLFYLPGEGIVKAIMQKWQLNFSQAKIIFDCFMVATAILITWIFTGKIQGVREGTIIAAICVGLFIKILDKPLSPLKNYIGKKGIL